MRYTTINHNSYIAVKALYSPYIAGITTTY